MEKSTKIILIVIIVALISAGMGFFAYNNGVFAKDPKISEDEAKTIAEEHTGGEAISVHVEKEGFTTVYEVVVVNATGEWEVEIDSQNGDILEIEENDGPEDEERDDDDDDDDEDDY
ncbi:MAG: PepSY domain-containing protein [Thermoplasmata archaeon]|nr:MAG: PepSY domain-containing protein [Thermoplasmata archaeon]